MPFGRKKKGKAGLGLFRKGMGGGKKVKVKKVVRRPRPVRRRPGRRPVRKVRRRFNIRQGQRVIRKIVRGVAEYMYVPEDYECDGEYEEIEGEYY